MAEYMLSVIHEEGYELDFDTEEMERIGPKVDAVNEELHASGAWVFGGGLHPPASATVVRGDGDTVSMIDGPYSESKEQVGGFWVIDVADLDAALEWASKATLACEVPIEVRPFHGIASEPSGD